MFKPGQEVIVLLLHRLEFDGSARVIKLMDYGENKGKWLVDAGSNMLCVPEERLVDAKEYWRKKNGSNPTTTPTKSKPWK
jgi:hypothetical protein